MAHQGATTPALAANADGAMGRCKGFSFRGDPWLPNKQTAALGRLAGSSPFRTRPPTHSTRAACRWPQEPHVELDRFRMAAEMRANSVAKAAVRPEAKMSRFTQKRHGESGHVPPRLRLPALKELSA